MPGPGSPPPGAALAMSVVHPGSPALRMRYRHGVLVTPYGFPDWVLCARALVALPPPDPGLTRDEQRVVDVLAGNAAMAAAGPDADPLWATAGPTGRTTGPAGGTAAGGEVATPPGWCWAHVAPGAGPARQLALVPVELHGSYRHAGGVRLLPNAGSGQTPDPEPAPVGPGPAEPVPDDVLDIVERLLGWPLPKRYRRYLDRKSVV